MAGEEFTFEPLVSFLESVQSEDLAKDAVGLEMGKLSGFFSRGGILGGFNNPDENQPTNKGQNQGILDTIKQAIGGGQQEDPRSFGTPPPDLAPGFSQPPPRLPAETRAARNALPESKRKQLSRLIEIQRIDPKMAELTMKFIQSGKAEDFLAAAKETEAALRESNAILNQSDESINSAIADTVRSRAERGLESPKLIKAAQANDMQTKRELLKLRRDLATKSGDMFKLRQEEVKAQRTSTENRIKAGETTDLAILNSQLRTEEEAAKPVKPGAKFEDVLGPDGKIIAQKNVTTGEVKKSPLASGGKGEKATFAKSPGVVVELPDGSFAQAIPVIDTRTGTTVNKIVPLEGQPVSRIGETGEALTNRKIREAGGKALTKSQITRLATDMDDGISAAKGMAVVNRSIKLLDDLTTGGFDAIKVRAKQLLGTETANEAELVANMGKQVLAQLRPIFGSQFTEREGATLTRIEAGFGKSTEGNIRLLNQMKQLIQRAAKRGISAAVETKDFRTAGDIQDLMEFTLQEDAPTTEEALGGGEPGAEDLTKLSMEELLAR